VIFMPKEAGSISQVLFMVRYLHDRMLELGLCVRGAVTLGDMYWNAAWSNDGAPGSQQQGNVAYQCGRNQNLQITLGPGLIEAHKLESECAVYPRVLVSQKLFDHADARQISCSPFGPYPPPNRPLTDFFRVDADGLRFLDLLHPEIIRNDNERIVRMNEGRGRFSISWEREGNTHRTVMRNVHSLIRKWIGCSEEKIRAKYEWLKSYAATQ
jgi:hypothetical protein